MPDATGDKPVVARWRAAGGRSLLCSSHSDTRGRNPSDTPIADGSGSSPMGPCAEVDARFPASPTPETARFDPRRDGRSIVAQRGPSNRKSVELCLGRRSFSLIRWGLSSRQALGRSSKHQVESCPLIPANLPHRPGEVVLVVRSMRPDNQDFEQESQAAMRRSSKSSTGRAAMQRSGPTVRCRKCFRSVPRPWRERRIRRLCLGLPVGRVGC